MLRCYHQFILTTTARYVLVIKESLSWKAKLGIKHPLINNLAIALFPYFLPVLSVPCTGTKDCNAAQNSTSVSLGAWRDSQSNQSAVGGVHRGSDVALTELSRHIYRLFVKPSHLWHCWTDNRITGDVDLKFGSIAHYCNAKPIFC